MELNDGSDVAVKRVDARREKLRVVFAEVRAILAQQNQLYDQLDAIEEKILETKDLIGDCHQHYLEIEMDIEMSEKSIERCVSVLQTSVISNNDIKNNLIVNNRNDNNEVAINNNIDINNNVRFSDKNPLIKKVNVFLIFL